VTNASASPRNTSIIIAANQVIRDRTATQKTLPSAKSLAANNAAPSDAGRTIGIDMGAG
jgi:hypothetical protein